MRRTDVRDDFQDGIDPAPMPPMAPDGGPQLEPARPIQEPPPRLCEAGPCRHYHRMEVQLDAADPLPERRDGKLIRHARVFHVSIHHHCYPDVGIETNLGSAPVLACNRWAPLTGLLRRTASVRKAYDRELAAWHDARETESTEVALAAVSAVASGEVESGVDIGVVFIGSVFRGYDSDEPSAFAIHVIAMPEDSIESVIHRAFPRLTDDDLRPGTGLHQIELSTTSLRSSVAIGPWPGSLQPLDNLAITVAQLALEPTDNIVVTLHLKGTSPS